MKNIKKEYAQMSSLDVAKLIAKTALDKKAEDLVILDVSELSGFADYFVIMSGRSTRHVQGLAAALESDVCSKRLKTTSTEGLEEGQWVLLDFNDVIVHIFYTETRGFYDIEGLWHDAPRVSLP